MIKAQMPEVKVFGRAGRKSAFEISINNKPIYSKIFNDAFPKNERIIEEIVKASKGEEFGEVSEIAEDQCMVS